MRTITVQRKHIETANVARHAGDSIAENCPLALAFKDAGVTNPRVHDYSNGAYVEHGADGKRRLCLLPPACQNFIKRWDNLSTAVAVEPFTFHIAKELT